MPTTRVPTTMAVDGHVISDSELTASDILAIRASAVDQAIGELQRAIVNSAPSSELLARCQPIAEGITDAIASGETRVLAIVERALAHLLLTEPPDTVAARLDTLREMAAQARARRISAVTTLEPGTHAYKFIKAVVAHPGVGNPGLADILVTSPALVSRTGGRLEDEGFVRRVRRGRHTFWYPTPHGSDLLRRVDHLGDAQESWSDIQHSERDRQSVVQVPANRQQCLWMR